MSARQRTAALSFVLLLGFLAALVAAAPGGLWAGPRDVPAKTAQLVQPMTPEPPLADAPIAVLPRPDVPPGSPCPVDPPPPVVALRVRVPASASAGQELEYRICVENCSPAAAHHVIVRNPVPGNARFVRAKPEPTTREPELVWQLGTLEACACREIILVLAPTGGDVHNCARVQFEHGQCVTTRVAGPELGLRKVGPAQAVLYEPMTYHLIVTNTGGVEVTGVVVTDTLPAGLEHPGGKNPLTWEVGTLAPGKSRHIEYQVIAKATGRLCNQAVVTAAGGLKQEATSCVVVGEAKLEVIKVAGPERHLVNLPVKYDITVNNPGSLPLTNVVITDTLPPQLTFVSASSGGQARGNQVQWSIGTLAAGARRGVQLIVQATAAGELRNQVTATADHGVSAQAEAKTTFAGGAGLTFGIVDVDDPVEVGQETSYLVTVINQGNAAATNLRLETTVPAQMTVSRTEPAGGKQDGQKLTYEAATLPASSALSFRVYVKAQQTGDVRFKVDLSADQLPAGPVHKEESTTIFSEPPAARLEPPAAPQGRKSP